MKKQVFYLVPKLFAVTMLLNGAADFYRPASIVEAMEALRMPLYVLWILGSAKILGGGAILWDGHRRLTEWSFAGFFIWAFGGIASHVGAGHSLEQLLPISVLTAFLIVSFLCYDRTVSGEWASRNSPGRNE